jgi:2-polyprenyl-6-methoxyphenol hydroxylase-like FAD-dependent oxidoreductase
MSIKLSMLWLRPIMESACNGKQQGGQTCSRDRRRYGRFGGSCSARRFFRPGVRVGTRRSAIQPQPASRDPHDKHLHGLTGGGQQALGELFSGFEQDLIQAGAASLRVAVDLRWEIPGAELLPLRDFGRDVYGLTRPLIEFTVRQHVERLTNVVLCPNCRALEILTARLDSAVTGVCYENARGQRETLSADLIIDASGRGAPTLAVLRRLGFPMPEETEVGIDLHYATATFAIPDDPPSDWKAVATLADAPEQSRSGFMMPTEGGRWVLTLTGRHGDRPPVEPAAFMAFVRSLRTPTIYHAIKEAKLLAPIVRFAFPGGVWRHFERIRDFPRGLLPIGDSICRFNPVYGQGMSVASLEARRLQDLLRRRGEKSEPLAGLEADFFTEIRPVIESAWSLSTIQDLIYPDTTGERPADFEHQIKFLAAVGRLARRDAEIHRLMVNVQQLLVPISHYREPDFVSRVKAEMADMAAA